MSVSFWLNMKKNTKKSEKREKRAIKKVDIYLPLHQN